MESLGILEEKENRYFVKKVTGPPAQFLFTRFYLNITQGKLEKPVELGDIEMEYTLYFPSNTFAIPWYKECGQEKPFFEIIAAGTKARLLKDDFVRMVGLGLISPIDIAKVLKAYKENKLLEELWNKFDNSIKASSKTLPINYKELKKEFDFNG
jgi:hypothetical protein